MSWNYILFDLDGTISDSSEGITNGIKHILSEAGLPIPEMEELMQYIGPPLPEGLQNIAGMSSEDAMRYTIRFRERYNRTGLYENELYPGIEQMCSRLKEAGKVLALATCKPEETAVRIMEHFGVNRYFDEMVGSSGKDGRNTKAEVIQEALRRLKLNQEEKSEVLMVGDREHDVFGAKACGVSVMGVCYGFAQCGELEAAGADIIVETTKEVADKILESE